MRALSFRLFKWFYLINHIKLKPLFLENNKLEISNNKLMGSIRGQGTMVQSNNWRKGRGNRRFTNTLNHLSHVVFMKENEQVNFKKPDVYKTKNFNWDHGGPNYCCCCILILQNPLHQRLKCILLFLNSLCVHFPQLICILCNICL